MYIYINDISDIHEVDNGDDNNNNNYHDHFNIILLTNHQFS